MSYAYHEVSYTYHHSYHSGCQDTSENGSNIIHHMQIQKSSAKVSTATHATHNILHNNNQHPYFPKSEMQHMQYG